MLKVGIFSWLALKHVKFFICFYLKMSVPGQPSTEIIKMRQEDAEMPDYDVDNSKNSKK